MVCLVAHTAESESSSSFAAITELQPIYETVLSCSSACQRCCSGNIGPYDYLKAFGLLRGVTEVERSRHNYHLLFFWHDAYR